MDCLHQPDSLYDHITCTVCLQVYQDPHALRCLHTFCCQCIDKLQIEGIIECPVCRNITQRVEIQKDFKTQALTDTLKMQGSGNMIHEVIPPQCDMCDIVSSPIKSKCDDCKQFMCERCEMTHSRMKVSKDHSVQNVKYGSCLIKQKAPETEKIKKLSKEKVDQNVQDIKSDGQRPTQKKHYCKKDYRNIIKGIKHINIVSPAMVHRAPEVKPRSNSDCNYEKQNDEESSDVSKIQNFEKKVQKDKKRFIPFLFNKFRHKSNESPERMDSPGEKKSRWNQLFRWGDRKKDIRDRLDYWNDRRFEFDDIRDRSDDRANDMIDRNDDWREDDEDRYAYEKNDYWNDRRINRDDRDTDQSDRWNEGDYDNSNEKGYEKDDMQSQDHSSERHGNVLDWADMRKSDEVDRTPCESETASDVRTARCDESETASDVRTARCDTENNRSEVIVIEGQSSSDNRGNSQTRNSNSKTVAFADTYHTQNDPEQLTDIENESRDNIELERTHNRYEYCVINKPFDNDRQLSSNRSSSHRNNGRTSNNRKTSYLDSRNPNMHDNSTSDRELREVNQLAADCHKHNEKTGSWNNVDRISNRHNTRTNDGEMNGIDSDKDDEQDKYSNMQAWGNKVHNTDRRYRSGYRDDKPTSNRNEGNDDISSQIENINHNDATKCTESGPEGRNYSECNVNPDWKNQTIEERLYGDRIYEVNEDIQRSLDDQDQMTQETDWIDRRTDESSFIHTSNENDRDEGRHMDMRNTGSYHDENNWIDRRTDESSSIHTSNENDRAEGRHMDMRSTGSYHDENYWIDITQNDKTMEMHNEDHGWNDQKSDDESLMDRRNYLYDGLAERQSDRWDDRGDDNGCAYREDEWHQQHNEWDTSNDWDSNNGQEEWGPT